MVEIVLEKITKIFGKNVIAVRDLDLVIKDKEFMVLLGPSGCGKTTTLYMIAGIYKPTRGNIYFDSKLMNDVEPKDRNIGMVFQSYALYPHMSVFDNIAYPLKIKKLPKQEIVKRVRDVAEMLKIDHLLDRKPSQLSGGQQQRVALARAIAKHPDVFLMDEPLSNLDAKIRVEIRAELKNLQKRLGITTIYVTHDQAEAMSLADRVAIMNSGSLEQVATPEELYSKPASLFVASFIGSVPANIIRVEVGEDYKAFLRDREVAIPRELIEAIRVSGSKIPGIFYIMVRPEDVSLYSPGESDLVGEVFSIEYLGKDLVYYIKIHEDLTIRAYTSRENLLNSSKVGVKINWKKAKIYREDGKLIV